MFTSDDAVRDVRVSARHMQDSPALVMLPLYDGGSGACSDCSGGAGPFGLGSEGLQGMDSMEVEGGHRAQACAGGAGQQRGPALPTRAAAAGHADGEAPQSLTVPFLEENVRLGASSACPGAGQGCVCLPC